MPVTASLDKSRDGCFYPDHAHKRGFFISFMCKTRQNKIRRQQRWVRLSLVLKKHGPNHVKEYDTVVFSGEYVEEHDEDGNLLDEPMPLALTGIDIRCQL